MFLFPIVAASAALSISDIPWNGPVGAVRVGREKDNFIINPNRRQQHNSDLNIIVTTDKSRNVCKYECFTEYVNHTLCALSIAFTEM